MMRLTVTFALLGAVAAAQNLTPAQKEADFRYLASLFSTYYAPLEWKKQLFGFDALDIAPWLKKVAATKTDLDFFDVQAEYVASLNDSGLFLELTTDFRAQLGFSVDVFDGALLVDSVSRTLLPARDYPFTVGDELVSIDGMDAKKLLDQYVRYTSQGSSRAASRLAAAYLASRPQWIIPHAPEVGENAVVVIRRQSGATESYSIPWVKSGTPLEVGPVPSPRMAASVKNRLSAGATDYTRALSELQWSGEIPAQSELVSHGGRAPVFAAGLPSTFTRRLGASAADYFYSGTFKWDELTIGYIRVPSYSPASQAAALQQLDREIVYLQANTDGLIIDVMRNPGGSLCYAEAIASRFISEPFNTTGFALRPDWGRVMNFYSAMISAKNANASAEIVAQYEMLYNSLLEANRKGLLVTGPLPVCTSSIVRAPFRDRDGNFLGYTKPVMGLVDEFSTGAAESFAGMMEDANRAVLFGVRTNGAGGISAAFDAGVFSESYVGMTLGLLVRDHWVGTADYPTTRYIENVGIRPGVEEDYMTRDNLLKNGAPFISSFLEHMAAYIRSLK